MSATQMYYMLQWPRQVPPLIEGLVAEHRLGLHNQLREAMWLASINDPARYRDLMAGPEPDTASVQAALAAPQLCRALTQACVTLDPEDALAALQVWQAELLRQRDFESPGDTAGLDLIGECIGIDFDSVQCLRIEAESSTLCNPPQTPSPAQRALVLDKLRAALAMVDAVAGTAGLMVRHVTRVIRVRFATLDNVAAETDPRDIGEVRLLNPHLPQTRVIDLADALIHESLHNLLAMFERRQGSFVAYDQTAQVRPVSPWTGNPIPYNAFTHAVFIYFGLFHFYRLLYRHTGDADQRAAAAELIGKCSRGFRLVPLAECLRLVGESPAWLLALYERMSEDVRSHYASGQVDLLLAA